MEESKFTTYSNAAEQTIPDGNLSVSNADNYKKPLVTVLMPCYNASAYIELSIEAVLRQDYPHFELLIVDDGSSDRTLEIIGKFSDKRIKIISYKNNKGITYALNKGLKFARGKYLARIDADDIMLFNRLTLQINFLERYKDYGLVGGWHEVINIHGEIINRIRPTSNDKELKLQLLFYNPFAHSAITMRMDLAKHFKYNKNYQYCEDYDLWMRISEVSKVKNLPFYLLQYRIHNSNTSSNNAMIMKQNVTNLISKELNKLGIKYSVDELSTHLAVGFGYRIYFDSCINLNKLDNWIKVLSKSLPLKERCGISTIRKFKKKIFANLKF